MTNKITFKTITINNNVIMTDWKKIIIIDFQTLDSTYLWCDCWDIGRTSIIY